MVNNKYNIIGFWDRKPNDRPVQMSCDHHPGSILILVKGEFGFLQCRECGTRYPDPNYKDEAEELAEALDAAIKGKSRGTSNR